MALIQVNYKSKALMRTVPVQVVLPTDKYTADGYFSLPENGYPTLYLLHGLLGNYTDWTAHTDIQGLAEARNLAVVMPSGDNSFYLDHPDSWNMYATFVGKELVEATRRMFPLSRRREDTFIGGLSMGGFGAIRNGLKYAETFGAIIGLSSAVHILEDYQAGKNRNFAFEASCFGDLAEAVTSDKNPRVLIWERAEQTPECLPRIFMACGTEDSLIDVNRVYRDLFLRYGFDVTYHECPGEHNWDFWDRFIREALAWLPLEEAIQGISSGHVKQEANDEADLPGQSPE